MSFFTLFIVPFIFIQAYGGLENSNSNNTSLSTSTEQDIKVIHQKMISSTSSAASASAPGLKPQEIVFALPLKDYSKI
jgi:hypothetical protein